MTVTNADRRRANREARLKRKKKIHKVLTGVLLAMCVVTAVIVVAALFSGDAYNDEDSFKAYASKYFKEVDETKNVGQPQELVKFGTPLSAAMEYPITGQASMDGYIQGIAEALVNQFETDHKGAEKEDTIAMLVDYDSYKTQRAADDAYFLQYLHLQFLNGYWNAAHRDSNF